MRIISGTFKSRRINPPANLPVRPTTDKAREALFNILMTWDFEESDVLDLFSGTGSVALEFVSRGARNVTAVEQNSQCVQFIAQMEEILEIDNLYIEQTNVLKYVHRASMKYDIIFADPPYDMDELKSLPDLIFENSLLNDEGLFILEHDAHNDFSDHPKIIDQRKYGKVHFSFFLANTDNK
ncbi:MAG: 16S rRNA (guanine(966)-N(2))-methyltransferase RsmD [Bacteroidota bacterium]